jgi:DNA-binding NtrC family response regulator
MTKYERRLIYLALKRMRGSVTEAAEMLCINRTTLEEKINKLDLRKELDGLRSKDPR